MGDGRIPRANQRHGRILVTTADPGVPLHGPSGASAHLRDVASAFARAGHEVTVATITPHDDRGRYAADFDLPGRFCGRSRARAGVRGFFERLDAFRLARRCPGPFDVVYERASLYGDAGIHLARRIGARHVLEVNSPLDRERRRRGRLRWCVRNTDRVIAVSPWMAAWARENGAREVVLVPNASALCPDRGVQRAPDAGLRLVHHGSLQPWHGTAFFPALLEALPEATLTVIGAGRLPAHPRIVHLPWLDAMPLARELSRAHVGLLPYPDDAPPWLCPLKLADYRNVGVPSVGSLHPAAAEADRRVGLGDPRGWAEAVRTLAATPPSHPVRTWDDVVPALLQHVPEDGPCERD